MRYNLRTLLILLAILPPLLWFGWRKYAAWKAEQELQRALGVWLDSRLGPAPIAIDFAFRQHRSREMNCSRCPQRSHNVTLAGVFVRNRGHG